MPPLRLLVTAPPGTGKTTLCERVRQQIAPLAAAPAPFELEGFLCHERRDSSGRRAGFDLVSLDGITRAPLASIDGPSTGKMVGRYHVQVEAFEGVALPILERVAAGTGLRLLIFDEIGKMELMSSRFVAVMRRLLASRDAGLHILGTVALYGGGFVAESKRIPGVEVVEIDTGSRDAAREDVFRRYAQALSQDGGAAPKGAKRAAASADAQSPPRAVALPGTLPFTFSPAPPPGQFTPVYPDAPGANLASLNAGDYMLYVGGAAINKAFAEELRAVGLDPKGRFEPLHEALLSAASAAPGTLCWLRPGDLYPKGKDAGQGACAFCYQQAECWGACRAGSLGQRYCASCWKYYEEEAFNGLLAFCGLVPAGGDSGAPGPLLDALRPVGLVSVAIFRQAKRPRRNERNVAMVYAVGPNCGGTRKKGRREVDKLSLADFVLVLESIGQAVALAVTGYNRQRTGMADAGEAPPRIDALRVCLLSGGVYKHPEATKEDVAGALVRGIGGAHDGEHSPSYDFAWDDDAFANAWAKLQREAPRSAPSSSPPAPGPAPPGAG